MRIGSAYESLVNGDTHDDYSAQQRRYQQQNYYNSQHGRRRYNQHSVRTRSLESVCVAHACVLQYYNGPPVQISFWTVAGFLGLVWVMTLIPIYFSLTKNSSSNKNPSNQSKTEPVR